MPFIQVLVFVIKYGPGVLTLVRGIWELVDWIKARDEKVTVSAKMMKQNLHVMAKKARKAKDLGELQKMHATLSARKSEIEGGNL